MWTPWVISGRLVVSNSQVGCNVSVAEVPLCPAPTLRSPVVSNVVSVTLRGGAATAANMPRLRDRRGRKLNAMTAVRWFLVPVTAFAVWFGTLLIGITGSTLLDSLCPPDLMVSGLCTAAWHRPAMAALEMMCACIAAVGFIVLPAKMAPAYRPFVGVVCFVVGGLLTFQLAMAGALWWPSAVAAIAGILALGTTIRQRSANDVPRDEVGSSR